MYNIIYPRKANSETASCKALNIYIYINIFTTIHIACVTAVNSVNKRNVISFIVAICIVVKMLIFII